MVVRQFCPRLYPRPPNARSATNEWQVNSLPSSVENHADAAIFALLARAAQNQNDRLGLTTDLCIAAERGPALQTTDHGDRPKAAVAQMLAILHCGSSEETFAASAKPTGQMRSGRPHSGRFCSVRASRSASPVRLIAKTQMTTASPGHTICNGVERK